MNFFDLITNKNVAIVGPAAYMNHSGLGSKIDSHDTVVRINRSIETTNTHFVDVGRRTDILYSCLIEKSANAGKLNGEELRDHYGIKFICAPPKSSMTGVAHQTILHDMVDINNVRRIAEMVPIRIVDHEFHTALALKVKCRPNTGFLALYDLLRFKPAKLSVYGFSFYLDGFMPKCKEGIEKEISLTEKEFVDKCFNSQRHNQKNMWRYAKETLTNNQLVNLDETLTTILALTSLDRNLFKESLSND